MPTPKHKTLPCDHCGTPQHWPGTEHARVLCAICAPRHSLKREITPDLPTFGPSTFDQ